MIHLHHLHHRLILPDNFLQPLIAPPLPTHQSNNPPTQSSTPPTRSSNISPIQSNMPPTQYNRSQLSPPLQALHRSLLQQPLPPSSNISPRQLPPTRSSTGQCLTSQPQSPSSTPPCTICSSPPPSTIHMLRTLHPGWRPSLLRNITRRRRSGRRIRTS